MNTQTVQKNIHYFKDMDPRQFVPLFFENAIDKITLAKQASLDDDFRRAGEYVKAATAIVEGLRDSLDIEEGGELAHHLEDIYRYVAHRLKMAKEGSDIARLDESRSLLMEIYQAWWAVSR